MHPLTLALAVLGSFWVHSPFVLGWGENVSPKLRVNYLSQKSDTVKNFMGNQTHQDHFKLLQSDGVSLLIGARNVVYNLSLSDLSENVQQRISWPSIQRDRDLCLVKGKSEDECQNYIRVLAASSSQSLLVCGTNSFNPQCRKYSTLGTEEYQMTLEYSGKGFCPHDPKHNSTAIYADGKLYAGTVSDFSGSDALILKDQIRTPQYDLKHLNAPDFVSSLEDDDHVYFFFRESAVEYINCGKAVYSRVARVCKSDSGGPHKFKDRWTTFMKARLNCSVPGQIPFYFNEIQATTSNMVDIGNGDKLIYGVFTTPENAIAGSAICSFKLSDILHSFDGPFKGQSSQNANWLPIWNTPSPRPGSCNADSGTLTERNLNFIKNHPLMDEAVMQSGSKPVLVQTGFREKFTVIAVDPQVSTPYGESYDVLFVGTTRGQVLKIITAKDLRKTEPVIIEDIQVFPHSIAVTNVQVVRDQSQDVDQLIVLSNHEVKSLPLNRCTASVLQTCSSCVALRDPYCAWNLLTNSCVDHRLVNDSDGSAFLQSIANGRHEGCVAAAEQAKMAAIQESSSSAREHSDSSTTAIPEELDIYIDIADNEISQLPHSEGRAIQSTATIYSTETLTLVSLIVAVLSLLIGFAGGFFTAKRCTKDNYTSCGHHYLETQTKLNKQNDMALTHSESGYTTAPFNNSLLSHPLPPIPPTLPSSVSSFDISKQNNLLVNVPLKDDLIEKNTINTQAIYNSPQHTATISRTGTFRKGHVFL
ncbi:semaphorin-1A-like [Tigriopus californicus]|uniref:semaphorin-1A-like n=1 Tax=Tigriopus californicus TaxID=6832 RepID=UPI0027DA7A16|nr:semaphorin-1A-like [Tigriopus californicus]